MNVSVRIQPPRRRHKRFNKGIVFPSTDAGPTDAQIQVVIEQLLVISSTVENDWQRPCRMDTGTQRGQDQFCDGDEDPTHSIVSNAEDLSN